MLRRQARRAERMRVSGSPTLYLGGRRYEGPGERLAILRAVCSTLPAGARGAAVCRGLPACFSDADCRKPGVVAECVEAGTARAKCVEHPAVQVALTVVEDGDAVWSARARIVDSLRVFFPGLVERRVDFRGPEGAALAERFGIERLPAYVLGPEALTERNIEAVRTALVPVAGSLVLAPGLAGSHQDATRPRQPGRVDLFLAPHSTQAAEALGEALDFAERGASCPIGLRAAVWRDAEGRLAAQGGLAEIESMLREIAVSELWPARSAAYRRACLGRIGTSYWLDAVVEAGLDPDAVRRAAESSLAYALLEADAQELAELGAGGAVVLLVSNQELVPAASRLDLRRALDAALDLAGRQGPAPDGEPSEDARPGADSPPCFSSERAGRAVPLLVRALEAAPEPARARIAQGLAALTREAFGTDASRWRKWARERKLGR